MIRGGVDAGVARKKREADTEQRFGRFRNRLRAEVMWESCKERALASVVAYGGLYLLAQEASGRNYAWMDVGGYVMCD